MRTRILVLLFLVSFTLFAGNNKADKATEAKAKAWVKNQQLEFIENKGQFTTTEGKPADNVLFKTSFGSCDIYITDKGISYVFIKFEEKEEVEESNEAKETYQNSAKSTHVSLPSPHRRGAGGVDKGGGGEVKEEDENKNILYYRLDMDLVGANITKDNIIKEEESPQGHYNYFYPHCPEGIYDVKGFGKITIKNIYKGIDWVIYTNKNNKEHPLKYDFIIHPEANYKDIKIKYLNAQSISLLDKDTKLKIQTIAGNIEEGNIYTYQNNKEKEIQSKYIINNDSTISFTINDYDKTQDLVIDPLVWATYYGGSFNDGFVSICVDSTDNILITGYSSSLDFPTQQMTGAFWQAIEIYCDITILKFNNIGVRLWATYYGGSNYDYSNSICIDSHYDIYILGYTSSTNMPVQQLAGAYWQPTSSGIDDLFIIKFNNQGIRMWATYYGGSLKEISLSICVDSQDDIYILGLTLSTDIPTQQLTGAYWQASYGGGHGDYFILKFNDLGIRQWATYYGGSGDEWIGSLWINGDICIDKIDNVYITGGTKSTNLPLQQLIGSFWQPTFAGFSDAFILKFNSQGVRLWATYYGGSLEDIGNSICFDSQNNLYITGYTRSLNFPTQQLTGAYWQGVTGGMYDAFILKFNNQGIRQWATYYGGNDDDYLNDLSGNYIFSDKHDNIYVTGSTESTNFPTQQLIGEYWQPIYSGGFGDAFILMFNKQGARKYATYYGSSYKDFGRDITVDNNNNIYFIGEWLDTGAYTINPGNGAYFDSSWCAMDDSFILKITSPCIVDCPTTLQTNRNNICANDTGTITLIAIGGTGDTLKWYKVAYGLTYIGKDSIITIPSPTQTTVYYARWESSCDTSTCDSVIINVIPLITTNINPLICQGQIYNVGIHNYAIAGTYKDTLISNYGCDSIVTINLTVNPKKQINLNPIICQGDIFQVGTHNYALAGNYKDTLSTYLGCDSIITTNLTVNPKKYKTLNPVICQGEFFHIANHNYTIAGIYKDTLSTYFGCDSIVTTNLTVNPVKQINLNSIICQGETFQVGTHIYTLSGHYNDTLATSFLCDSIITTNLTVVPIPKVKLSNDTTLCIGKTIFLDATNQNSTYLWQDSTTNPTYTVNQQGLYWVIVKVDSNCIVSDTIQIYYKDCSTPDIYIPNSFTPNGDGLNDVFKIETLAEFSEFHLYIYDRWGEQLFESNDKTKGWDGTYKGKLVPNGVYVYLVTGIIKDTNEQIKRNGTVTVIR